MFSRRYLPKSTRKCVWGGPPCTSQASHLSLSSLSIPLQLLPAFSSCLYSSRSRRRQDQGRGRDPDGLVILGMRRKDLLHLGQRDRSYPGIFLVLGVECLSEDLFLFPFLLAWLTCCGEVPCFLFIPVYLFLLVLTHGHSYLLSRTSPLRSSLILSLCPILFHNTPSHSVSFSHDSWLIYHMTISIYR